MYYDSTPRFLAVVGTLFAVSSMVLFLRIYTRITRSVWGYDDWFMTIGYIPIVAFTAFCISGAQNGLGAQQQHLLGGVPEELRGLRDLYFVELFYCLSLLFVKTSIILLLMRIAARRTVYLCVLYFTIALTVIPLLYTIIDLLARCNHIEGNWNPYLPGAKCTSITALTRAGYALGAFSIVTDWTCAILPIFLLWKVQMNKSAKITVSAILGLGFFASVASMIRLKYTIAFSTPGPNYFFDVVDLVIWAYCEAAVGMIVGCASTLKPLFAGVFKMGSSQEAYNLHHHGTGLTGRSWSRRDKKSLTTDSDKDGFVTTVDGAMQRLDSRDERSLKDTESQEQSRQSNGIYVRHDIDSSSQGGN